MIRLKTHRRHCRWHLLSLAFVLLGTGSALAEGPGVRTGDFVIHPSAWLAGGYDSNVFLESTRDASATNDAILLRVGGGLGVRNRHPDRVDLRLDTNLTYRHFASINELDPAAADLVSSRNGISDAQADAFAGFNPNGSVSLELEDDFRYTERPPYSERQGLVASAGKSGNPTSIAGFQKINNAAGADLVFRPGSGSAAERALELRLGYRFRIVRFLDGEDVGAARANLNAHELRMLGKWRFLPKTALELDVQYHINDYAETTIDTGAGSREAAPSRDGTPLWAWLGLRGLVTQRLSLILRAGYGNSFNDVGESFSGLLARIELQYTLEPTLTARLGYTHGASPTAFSNFVTSDRVFAALEFHVGELTLAGRGEFGSYRYSVSGSPGFRLGGDPNGVLVTPERSDPVVRANASASYNLRDWLALRAEWIFEANLTDYQTPQDASSTALPDFADYTRHLVMLQVRADY